MAGVNQNMMTKQMIVGFQSALGFRQPFSVINLEEVLRSFQSATESLLLSQPYLKMSTDRENLENQSDSMEQNDPAKALIEERIRKKEKELQQVTSRIELLKKERELDLKIRQANNLERLYINNGTDSEIANEMASSHERGKQANLLTTENLVNTLCGIKLDENEEKLYRFAMRTIAEENMKGGLYNVVVTIYFSRIRKYSVKKGAQDQRMIIFFDEDNKPVYRWEIKNSLLKK
ncbi:uncharacterized protein LOC128557859 [Mercenaria mercenaria]|uniref:uncharacterized protein LOC128557859 n=1 Tax=Mercenaria mercenaria TaxID=6596 RepID=UPI00234F812D|nr:uncharacterized protein LOC128557859 [Mercenaria mercenaria]